MTPDPDRVREALELAAINTAEVETLANAARAWLNPDPSSVGQMVNALKRSEFPTRYESHKGGVWFCIRVGDD